MNCKKCNNLLDEEVKFCGSCGEQVKNDNHSINKEEKNSEDKKSFFEKQIIKVGQVSKAIGWVNIGLNILVFLWSIADSNFSDSGLPNGGVLGLIVACGAGALFITLGKQINQLKNIIQNMWILLGTCILMIIIAGATGGNVGFLLLIVIIYLISGLVKAYKLKKLK